MAFFFMTCTFVVHIHGILFAHSKSSQLASCLEMTPLVIVKVGDTFPALATKLGDFEQWITTGIGEYGFL
jgi:hypothetical protein